MFASPFSLLTSAFALLALSSTVSAKCASPSLSLSQPCPSSVELTCRPARAAADGVFDGGDGAQSKIDYQPPFTAPKGGEVYIAGQEYTASWCVSLRLRRSTRAGGRGRRGVDRHAAEPTLTFLDARRNQEIPSDIPSGNISKTADLVLGYDEEGSTSLHLSASSSLFLSSSTARARR